MQINYLCHGLSPKDAAIDERAIARFPGIVDDISPGSIHAVDRLKQDVIDALLVSVAAVDSFVELAAIASDILAKPGPLPKLVICCANDSNIAELATSAKPTALWGAQYGCLAAIYRHEPALIWHEMFHLLGAEDCYGVQSNGRHIPCGNRRCLMQYEPSVDVCGDPPFICEGNRRGIRSSLLKRRQAYGK